ncbi:MAG: hypothetical protein WC637_19750, partial [Victivallales bacterium]
MLSFKHLQVLAFLLPACLCFFEQISASPEDKNPPIPVRFSLEKEGFVTLVIENKQGVRIRNLVSETFFAAGAHTLWWDGCDDNHREPLPISVKGQKAQLGILGIYRPTGMPVAPGEYLARGIVRDALKLNYRFSAYNSGVPPWITGAWANDPHSSGGWLADHGAPSDVMFLPGNRPAQYRVRKIDVQSGNYTKDGKLLFPSDMPLMLITSPVAESGHGFIWTDTEGRKISGIRSFGAYGNAMTGALCLTRDSGSNPLQRDYAYYGNDLKGNIFVRALPDDRTIWEQKVKSADSNLLGGIAAYNGIVAISLSKDNQIVFVSANDGKTLWKTKAQNPRGLSFTSKGDLLVLCGTELKRFAVSAPSKTAESVGTIIGKGLEDPQRITVATDGNIFISDLGKSHQVKMFSGDGRFLSAIGKAGVPALGSYDPNQMHNPSGMALTPSKELWVAERDRAPKRVSVWSLDGRLLRAFYGPSNYGGGGNLDPEDPKRFYFSSWNNANGIEFALDWQSGSSSVNAVYAMKGTETELGAFREQAPQSAILLNGVRYMTNAYNQNPTGGVPIAAIWIMKDHVASPVAAAGDVNSWPLFKQPEYAAILSPIQASLPNKNSSILFVWSDRNSDNRPQPSEFTFKVLPSLIGSVTVQPDLSFITSDTVVLRPLSFNAAGIPAYDAAKAQTVIPEVDHFRVAVKGQVLETKDGLIIPGAPVRGYRDGKLIWTYPNEWPGLHASHYAPKPEHAGQMIGTTRLLGLPVYPAKDRARGYWALNGNFGNMYLMTTDGLFVATLGRDQREAPILGYTTDSLVAKAGMDLNIFSFGSEHFFPTINQTSDGSVYLTVGKQFCGIARLEGLESVQNIGPFNISVKPEDIERAKQYLTDIKAKEDSQKKDLKRSMTVSILGKAPVADGDIDEWKGTDWVEIKNSQLKAALAIAEGRLHVAYRTREPKLLENA